MSTQTLCEDDEVISDQTALRARIQSFRIGERVVIRQLLDDGSALDALGYVIENNASECVIRTAKRGDVAVPISAAIAAKRVPPPPPRRPDQPSSVSPM